MHPCQIPRSNPSFPTISRLFPAFIVLILIESILCQWAWVMIPRVSQAGESEQDRISISTQSMEISADQAELDQNGQRVTAWGHVTVTSGGDILSGDRLTLNYQTETGTLQNGSIFLHENHLYLKADEIRKTGTDTYTATRATLTACDGPAPDWRITGKDIHITLEGYGFAKHTTFWAGKVPLIYTPFWIFPVKTQRQTGFLIPEFGFSESRKGFVYRQPLFWAISDSADATFYSNIMTLRGIQLGAEFRYTATGLSSGAVMADGLNDARVDDGQGDNSSNWGYTDDGYLRPNSDRFWMRAKADQALPAGTTAKLDLDIVSDQDYLLEFRNGMDGFDQTRNYFRNTFGRDIDDEYETVRMNQLNLSRIWDRFSFNGDFRWYDNVTERRFGQVQDTVQSLPSLNFSAVEQPIATTPLYFSVSSSYDYFFRQDAPDGQRADLYAEIYYPLRLFDIFSLTSSMGLRQTFWWTRDDQFLADHGQDNTYRYLYDFKLDLNTEPYRIFQTGFGGGDRLKHIIKPELIYVYRSETDDNSTAYFDAGDRIEGENRLTFSLTNTLVTRRLRPKNGSTAQPYDYLSFLRFNISESFDIQKYNERDPRPFSDLLGELELMPVDYFSVSADGAWSPYDAALGSLNAGIHLWDKRMDKLDIGYGFQRTIDQTPGSNNLNIAGNLQITGHWQVRASHERNLETQTVIKTGLGFTYISQCWSLKVDYTEESDDRGVSATVNLTGLGGWGN